MWRWPFVVTHRTTLTLEWERRQTKELGGLQECLDTTRWRTVTKHGHFLKP
ncbi:hypothetical protein RchiOBHm_Chr7g0242521 [Rosa chinensis]|uniref:Uncharacterized protein n=1 Tax=Rosa chinensis TaxID=74649 RepID=A0A2P6PII3_ROSCH|nr:hypothetical protein RchiOBHm_Chr7g0242521 [Rosa chinensis]